MPHSLPLHCLIYSSTAAPDLTDQQARDIGVSAATLNAIDGVTGVLLYNGHSFVQLLEGVEAAVDDAFDRIRRDKRHSDIDLLLRASQDRRSFHSWSMQMIATPREWTSAAPEVAALAKRIGDAHVRDTFVGAVRARSIMA